MRKALSVFLCLLLVVPLGLPAFADNADDGMNGYPVIIVPGFMNSQMHMIHEDGTEEKVWLGDLNAALGALGDSALKLTADALLFLLGAPDYLRNTAAPIINGVIEKLACNPDGSSVYNIVPDLEPTAEATRWSNLRDEDLTLQDYIDDVIDTDDIYILGCDFRMDPVDNAKRLDALIDDILATTGCGKVNLLAQSYGGQVTGAYLSIFADTAGEKVNSAVLCCPALGGAAAAVDFLTGDIAVDEAGILEFVEYSINAETEYHWLLDSDPLAVADDLVQVLLPTFTAVAGSWLSVWNFIPYEYYKDVIERLQPDPAIVEKTTYFHEEIMKKYPENLARAQASGVNISIIAGAGMAALTGLQDNSDGIIPVSGATGATAAPFGQRFNDGYRCIGANCADPTHNHLSPSMEIDASTCYLPENTWIVDGYYHGQEMKDSATKALILRQLLSDHPLGSVHEDPAHPQFHAADGRAYKIFATFNNSVEGYLSAADTALRVTNTTHGGTIVITDVSAQGVDLSFGGFGKILRKGETAEIPFTGELPQTSLTRAAVTISYIVIGKENFTPVGQRTFDFTVMNGEAPAYDETTPYAPVDFEADMDSVIGGTASGVVGQLGLTKVVSVFVQTITRIIEIIRHLVSVCRSL